jgi:CO/xanthine dehydrogenase Mo-binding subunit
VSRGPDAARRRLLAGGGALSVGFLLPAAASAADALHAGARPDLPGSLRARPALEGWIRIDAQGAVSVFTGKVEFGQGLKTALIQVAAEELDLAPASIRLITADTALTPDEQFTAGSRSMQDSASAIRYAAAQVRERLLEAAALRLGVPVQALATDGGAVLAPDGRRVGYGALVGSVDLSLAARPGGRTKDPARYGVVGKSLPRVDLPGKFAGEAAYVQDLRLPGMLHARVLRGPGHGTVLEEPDPALIAAVRAMPGVVALVRDGRHLAVVAEGEWQAVRALRALERGLRWRTPRALPDPHALGALLQSEPAEPRVDLAGSGSAPAGIRRLRARYSRPYLMHAAIGPACAVARADENGIEVWTHSQGVYPLRHALAELLRLPVERIRCRHLEGAGSYGHNGADDAAADAALIARALPGRPVRVQWMRAQEHGWEPYGSAMVAEVEAGLDAEGRVRGWNYQVWSSTHTRRPVSGGLLLAAAEIADPLPAPPPRPIPMPEGDGDRNSIPLYRFGEARVVYQFVPAMPLRVSALRALGAYLNVFAIESFVDELAAAAGADPLAFRLRHLEDARARAVIQAAAGRFGWEGWRPSRPGMGRGLGFARYKNLGAYCAVMLELTADRDSGRVALGRIVAAVDSGQAVNPDGIRNQIEGAILQSASWTLFEAVQFDREQLRSLDWGRYPILRFGDLPESIEVVVIDRPGEPYLGTGEAAQGPTAAAIGNALAAARGLRLRDLPLSPPRLRERFAQADAP